MDSRKPVNINLNIMVQTQDNKHWIINPVSWQPRDLRERARAHAWRGLRDRRSYVYTNHFYLRLQNHVPFQSARGGAAWSPQLRARAFELARTHLHHNESTAHATPKQVVPASILCARLYTV